LISSKYKKEAAVFQASGCNDEIEQFQLYLIKKQRSAPLKPLILTCLKNGAVIAAL